MEEILNLLHGRGNVLHVFFGGLAHSFRHHVFGGELLSGFTSLVHGSSFSQTTR
jgi:hypothetical protein